MKVFQALLSITVTISCLFASTEAKKKDDDATAQAIRDMQAGMAGLKEASGNPAMLAQLMRDLQVSIVPFEWSVFNVFLYDFYFIEDLSETNFDMLVNYFFVGIHPSSHCYANYFDHHN